MNLKMGERIKQLRLRDGRRQEDLAVSLGISTQAVSRWELGNSYPDMEMLPAIANYFHVSIDSLFGYQNNREEKINAIVEEACEMIKNESPLLGHDFPTDNLEKCVELLREAAEEFPNEPRILMAFGKALHMLGWNKKGAKVNYDEKLGLYVEDVANNADNSYWHEALQIYEKVILCEVEKDQRDEAIIAMCSLYSRMGNYDKAKEIANKQVIQINNGVDPEVFAYNEEKRQMIQKELGISGMKVIGHIGAFITVKNHKFLIDVVEQAYKMDSAIRCVLIGRGELLDDIKRTVSSKGLADVVKFLGVRGDVNELLSAMDIFVMPSLYEGLPVSLIEVQANGLPAVVSDSITRNVKLQDNFYYLPLSDSPESWARKILEVINGCERADNNDCLNAKGFNITNTVDLYTGIIMEGDANGKK